ncbi:MAG: fibronectin type III domain-containing protein [Kiritimatiellae bacterium]|nr:fibronectin type III domain-containing protein [Kiritimatiellia bacterium]
MGNPVARRYRRGRAAGWCVLSCLLAHLCTSPTGYATSPSTVDPSQFHPGYYARVWPAEEGKAGTKGSGFEFLRTNTLFVGAMKGYAWSVLEPARGVYDFSLIEADLRSLRSRGKRLMVDLNHVQFGSGPPYTPGYMWDNAIYGGDAGHYGNYARKGGGWMSLLWNANVKARLMGLIAALGARFNGEPYVEGLYLGESAFEKPLGPDMYGWSPSVQRQVFIDIAAACRQALPDKQVWQGINWAPYEFAPFVAELAQMPVGIGWPDTATGLAHQQININPLFLAYHDVISTKPEVQYFNYDRIINPYTGAPQTPQEMLEYVVERVNPWYMVWLIREPYWSENGVSSVVERVSQYGPLPSVTQEDHVNIRIGAGDQDAEENRETGAVGLGSSDLELGTDAAPQIVALRFTNAGIRRASTILAAYVQFKADEASSGACTLTIEGQAADDAPALTAAAYSLSGRARTAASVAWQPVGWYEQRRAWTQQRTPDLAPIIQEIVNRAGWQDGNDLVLLIRGTGRRVAESYEGDSFGAPLLHIEYREPAAPAEPADVAARALSNTEIQIGWTDRSDDETQFKIRRSLDGIDFNTLAPLFVGPNVTSVIDSGLTPYTTYSYKVRAQNGVGDSAYVGPASARTDVTPVIAVSRTRIDVSALVGQNAAAATFRVWNGGTGRLDYNVVEQTGKFSVWPSSGSSLDAGEERTHTIAFTTADLSPGTYERTIRIEATGSGAANSPVAIQVSIFIPEPIPPAPAGFTAAEISSDSVRLIWDDLANEADYMLRISLDGAYWYDIAAVSLPANTTAYTVSGLNPNTAYFFKLRGTNNGGLGPYGEPVGVVTPRPDACTFDAYNDLCWAGGQQAANITGLGRGQSGLLRDHRTGEYIPVTLALSVQGGQATDVGANAAAGTEAAAIFGGIVDCRGVLDYATNELTLAIAGLAGARRYELTLFGNRADPAYGARTTTTILEDVEGFVNTSSAGAMIGTAGLTDDTTAIANGYNSENGFVARYDQIEPGADGEIRIRVPAWNGTGAAGRYYLNALRLRTVEAPPPTLARGTPWRYRKGTAEASKPASAWRQAFFDDSAWAEGATPIGYGTPVTAGTILADMQGRYTSIFLRRTLDIADPLLVGAIELEIDYDDGLILWLNGRELARANVAGEPGSFVPVNATASAYGNATLKLVLTGAQLPQLLPGPNALAAQVFNVSLAGSSDCLFNAQVNLVPPTLARSADADRNRLPDAWEQTHLADLTDPADRADSGDPDGDGVPNLEEWIAGTDPRDKTACLRLGARVRDARIIVEFQTVPAAGPGYDGLTRHYALEERAGLEPAAAWQALPGYEDILGSGQTVPYTDPGGQFRIYRARVWLE